MESLLACAAKASIRAGTEIMNLYHTTDFETKIDGSPVTEADMRAHHLLVDALEETNIPVLSEESHDPALLHQERVWIIDPLDGTHDFIRKTGDFAVMVGLIEHGMPILGVVYAPTHGKLYTAMKGHGAFIESAGRQTPLTVSDRQTKNLRMVHSPRLHEKHRALITHTLEATAHTRGGMGIKAAVLTEGGADFFFSYGKLGIWDVCAPQIIVEEAGGTVTDMEGNPLLYAKTGVHIQHGTLFSNGACHEHVRTTLESLYRSARARDSSK